jgi:sigma-B regulation protein RsbU (phosphoserine phosphatase)
LILRKGEPISTIAVSSLPLGIDENSRYKTSSFVLEPGDQLFLYTDGFVDACNSEDARFGDERLHAAVEELRVYQADQFVPQLMKSIDDFAGGEPQFDDLTAVLIDAVARKSHVRPSETAERTEQKHDG